MNAFKRHVVVGRTQIGGQRQRTTVTIDIEWNGKRLSIHGEGRRNPNWSQDFAGQIIAQVGGIPASDLIEVDWKQQARLVEVWERWHLNDMRPGCELQRAEGWEGRPIDPSKPTSDYGFHFVGQQYPSWNLLGWVRPDEHPDGLLTKPCPICGYKYGTGWLHEDVPDDVLEFLASLGHEVTEGASA